MNPPWFTLILSIAVGTKIIADPEKCFQELISGKLLISLRDRPWLEFPEFFSGFALLAGGITEISLKDINSSKKVFKITGPALFQN